MQVKHIEWRSDDEPEDSNSYPQLEVLTRSRMKMLEKLFVQMNVEVTPAKRHSFEKSTVQQL